MRCVEFADYLLVPTFWTCFDHPQFKHVMHPPEGYRFTQEPTVPRNSELLSQMIDELNPEVPLREYADPIIQRAHTHLTAVARQSMKYGANLEEIRKFFASRHIEQNARLPEDTALAFIPSVPYSLCTVPFIVEIEDTTTLFFPFLMNGETSETNLSSHWSFPMIKALLESEMCQSVLCHVQSTADSLRAMFQSEIIMRKVDFAPLGVNLPDITRKKPITEHSEVHLLFSNSWHQDPQNFYGRGGKEILEAFHRLSEYYPQLHLTIRSALPPQLPSHHLELLFNHPRVKLLTGFLSEATLHDLLLTTDIYLVPSARLHVVSILRALSYGIPVIGSDGWGIPEYVTHGHNGMIVNGRYGTCSWLDLDSGVLREDYGDIRDPFHVDMSIADGLVSAISCLVGDVPFRKRLSIEARKSVVERFSLDRWNRTMKHVLDEASDQIGTTKECENVPFNVEEFSKKTLEQLVNETKIQLRGKDLHAAESLSLEVIHHYYQSPHSWYVRGLVLKAKGDQEGAIDAFQKGFYRGVIPEGVHALMVAWREKGLEIQAQTLKEFLHKNYPNMTFTHV